MNTRPIVVQILDVVGFAMNATRADIRGGNRSPRATAARASAAYLMRRMTCMSFPEIATELGMLSHSTAIDAVRRVERRVAEDAALRESMGRLEGLVWSRSMDASVIAEARTIGGVA